MPIEPQRVLVVDDDPSVRAILVAALRQRPLIVDVASDGRSALELLNENHYTVVLLDIVMPELDGFGVLDGIDESRGPVPIVLVVSGADRSVLDQLDPTRIHGIVRKPFDPNEIATIVAACAHLRGRSAFETMAMATVMTTVPLMTWLKL
ncbi:MAG: response regulator [Thermoanaerobaculia bacterium]